MYAINYLIIYSLSHIYAVLHICRGTRGRTVVRFTVYIFSRICDGRNRLAASARAWYINMRIVRRCVWARPRAEFHDSACVRILLTHRLFLTDASANKFSLLRQRRQSPSDQRVSLVVFLLAFVFVGWRTSFSLSRASGTLSPSRSRSGGDRSRGRSRGRRGKPCRGRMEGKHRRRDSRGDCEDDEAVGRRAGGRLDRVDGRRERGDDPSNRAMPLNWIPAPFSRQSDAGRVVSMVGFSCSFSPVLTCWDSVLVYVAVTHRAWCVSNVLTVRDKCAVLSASG